MLQTYTRTSLVPRPPLAAFFATVEKNMVAKKAVRGGLGTRLHTHTWFSFPCHPGEMSLFGFRPEELPFLLLLGLVTLLEELRGAGGFMPLIGHQSPSDFDYG